jgi:hypothetical protein
LNPHRNIALVSALCPAGDEVPVLFHAAQLETKSFNITKMLQDDENILDLCKFPKKKLYSYKSLVCHNLNNQPNRRKAPVCSTKSLLCGFWSPSYVENRTL